MIPTHPRLAFTAADVPALRSLAAGAEGQAILAALGKALAVEPDGITIGSHAAGHALRHVLDLDAAEAQRSRAFVQRAMDGVAVHDSPPLWAAVDFKMIFRTKAAVDVALAYDLCRQAWPEDFRLKVALELQALARQFLKGGGAGFNDKPNSNWIGNTKAAAGFLAMAIAGDPGVDPDMPQLADRARHDFFAYLDAAYGDRGWCCEGFNYLRYPMTTSGFQFLQALTLAEGRDVVAGTPAQWIMPLYVTQMVPGPGPSDAPYVPFFGLSYPFTGKDVSGFAQLFEHTRWRSGDLAMGLGSASPAFQPAVLWTLHQIMGLDGDGTFDVHKPADAVYALANLARHTATPSRNPGELLPRTLADRALGYFVFRNRWRDRDDFVAAITANARPRRGTYSFQDAGSFRIYGLGVRWADQASRKDREWSREAGINRALENVVLVPGANGWPGGKVTHHAEERDGSGTVTMDISGAYSGGTGLNDAVPGDIKATRRFVVDYSGRCGAPALYVVVDHFQGGGEKTWTMHTAGIPRVTDHGFVIDGGQGATLTGTVLAPAHPAITIAPGRETHALCITGGDRFAIVMTVQRGRPPAVAMTGSAVRVGEQTIPLDDAVGDPM